MNAAISTYYSKGVIKKFLNDGTLIEQEINVFLRKRKRDYKALKEMLAVFNNFSKKCKKEMSLPS